MRRPLDHSTDGNGNLCGAVFAGSPCGCEIVGDGTLPHPLKIEYCNIHAAALTMHRQLLDIANYRLLNGGVNCQIPRELLELINAVCATLPPAATPSALDPVDKSHGVGCISCTVPKGKDCEGCKNIEDMRLIHSEVPYDESEAKSKALEHCRLCTADGGICVSCPKGEYVRKIRKSLEGYHDLNLSNKVKYFGKRPCDCCGDTLAGDRHEFTATEAGIAKGPNGSRRHRNYECCVDCCVYLFT